MFSPRLESTTCRIRALRLRRSGRHGMVASCADWLRIESTAILWLYVHRLSLRCLLNSKPDS
jgi:hypothetical protein